MMNSNNFAVLTSASGIVRLLREQFGPVALSLKLDGTAQCCDAAGWLFGLGKVGVYRRLPKNPFR
jgi:hypothetical protein